MNRWFLVAGFVMVSCADISNDPSKHSPSYEQPVFPQPNSSNQGADASGESRW